MATRRSYRSLRDLFANRRHWCQGQFRNGNGGYCLLGGLEELYGVWNDSIRHRRLIAAIRALFPEYTRMARGKVIAMFSDHPDRTHADILRVVRRARL